ncbi:hypothetical protein WMY93_029071 [Mugilogobius chulae]|uniref:Uncharacterized protein n=1 Tax=Mugilogobius chulae TaxID=88201 RepID=A0AAW0MUS9_9GOBI
MATDYYTAHFQVSVKGTCSRLVALLSLLYQLLAEQRKGERGLYVLRCLKEVASCQAKEPSRHHNCMTELSRLWSKIWSLTLRGVSSPHTEGPSQDLLASIIRGELINMDREFWKLFSGSACKPSQSSALCLSQALMAWPVPKICLGGEDGQCRRGDELEDSSRPHPIICRDFPDCLIASLLVSLTFKDTGAGLKFLLSSGEVECALNWIYTSRYTVYGRN